MRRPPYERGVTRHALVDVPSGLRAEERSVEVPETARPAVSALIRSWEFKRRAGFGTPDAAPKEGQEGRLSKRVLGVRFSEPIRVVWASEHGFGYETRPGHPLYGEESFVLDDGVFTARSISRPATLLWVVLAPALRWMQRSTHDRYIAIVSAEVRRCIDSGRGPAGRGSGVRPGNPK
ncbi:DUF1990 family protein [Microbacterium sp. 1.5R]|uniref:DUF1990 family protein n=1 Tax=Microbacterium sp. 1.5R TaxID=1916917 RepID=UPI0011A9A1E7|nr:DUF1990 family protein [Microbacterium sp. 1.5R]